MGIENTPDKGDKKGECKECNQKLCDDGKKGEKCEDYSKKSKKDIGKAFNDTFTGL